MPIQDTAITPTADTHKKLQEASASWWRLFDSKITECDPLGRHPGEKGQRRENALSEVLEDFLPRKYSVGSGEILAADGNISKQIDVIVYDALNSPLLANPAQSKIVPAESVYAVIEMKPDLKTSKDLQAAADNIRSAKKLSRAAIVDSHGGHHKNKCNTPMLGAIFTYKDHWPIEKIIEELHNHCNTWETSDLPDCICVGKEAVAFTYLTRDGQVTFCPSHRLSKEQFRYFVWKTGEQSLGYFLYHLFHMIAMMDIFPPDMFAYLGHRKQPCADVKGES